MWINVKGIYLSFVLFTIRCFLSLSSPHTYSFIVLYCWLCCARVVFTSLCYDVFCSVLLLRCARLCGVVLVILCCAHTAAHSLQRNKIRFLYSMGRYNRVVYNVGYVREARFAYTHAHIKCNKCSCAQPF